MSEHLEIEFKNMLTKEDYLSLITYYKLSEHDFFTQTNIYFDTADFKLKKQHTALRIRLKENVAEITFKEPTKIGLLETNITLTSEEYHLFDGSHLPSSDKLKEKLKKYHISIEDLSVIASLKTTRAEKKISYDALLVLDESWYHGTHDYELELEVSDYNEGLVIFNQLLNHHNLVKRPTKNKILRALAAKQALG